MRRKQLIIQFAISGNGTDLDLSLRHELEELFDGALRRNRSGFVDGGDIGSGQMNIFCLVDSWQRSMDIVLAHLKHRGLETQALVAKRLPSERYVVIWPPHFDGAFTIK